MPGAPEQLHVDFARAFNRHDVDAVVALYENGAILVSGDGPVEGAAAIREFYRSLFAAHPTIELHTLRVSRAGELAQLHGSWTLHFTGTDGSQIRSTGRNTETVRLQADGRWQFVLDDPGTID